MLASKIGTRSYSSVSPDFLAAVLQRVKEVPLKAQEAQQRARQNRRTKPDRTGNSPKHARNTHGNNERGGKNFRERRPRADNVERQNASNKPSGGVKRHSAPKISNSEEYNNIADKVETLVAKGSRRIGGKKTDKTVPGLKMDKTVQAADFVKPALRSSQYVPRDVSLLSLLKYRPSLTPAFGSRLVSYGVSTLGQANFPVNRQWNEGIKIGSKSVNTKLTISQENFGNYIPASEVKLELEPLTKNFKISPNLEELSQSVKGSYHTLKPCTKKDFGEIAKSDVKKEELFNNSEVVRISLEQSNLNSREKELLQRVCSGLAPVSELRA